MAAVADPVIVLRVKIDAQPFSLAIHARPDLGLTPRELGRLKRLASGVAGTDIFEALKVLDVEVIAALAVVAAERAGSSVDADAVFDGRAQLEIDWTSLADPPTSAAAADPAATSPSTSTIPGGTGGPS